MDQLWTYMKMVHAHILVTLKLTVDPVFKVIAQNGSYLIYYWLYGSRTNCGDIYEIVHAAYSCDLEFDLISRSLHKWLISCLLGIPIEKSGCLMVCQNCFFPPRRLVTFAKIYRSFWNFKEKFWNASYRLLLLFSHIAYPRWPPGSHLIFFGSTWAFRFRTRSLEIAEKFGNAKL